MSAAFDKLRSKLSELFQLDAAAELDFGIYRILNARRAEVQEFLDSLETQVDTILAEALETGTAEWQAELEKVEAGLRAGGFAEEMIATAPRVRELREKIAHAAADPAVIARDIFSHLTTFFSRYYKDGDFLSLRRYKKDTYAIPYEGEEVKLHWANADQYYIKSSETLRDYTFRLGPAPKDPDKADTRPAVTFKLIEADTEKDNSKAVAGQERRFIYQGLVEELTLLSPPEGKAARLVLGFAYLPVGKKEKQSDLNTKAAATILGEAAKGAFTALGQRDATYTGKKKEGRTTLDKHLAEYTGRNTFDYFIHKDLGGFLRRELDFYIKNEVIHLDDLEEAPEASWRETRAQLKALRAIAGKVIRFLAQLEDFQKRLWLKKKFVVGCDYVVTLDRVPEELYPEIAACEAQREEWVRLFAIEEVEGYSVPLKVEFLKGNPRLPVDTRQIDLTSKLEVLSMKLDDAVVLHSENSQALNLIKHVYRGRVGVTYIDPPYNTGSDGFIYRDGFQRSTWNSMIRQSLLFAPSLLKAGAGLFCSIDDNEAHYLRQLLEQQFGSNGFIANIVWQKRYAPDIRTAISDAHEHILVFSKQPEIFKESRNKLPLTDFQINQFRNPDQDPRGPWKSDNFTAQGWRPNQMYEIVSPTGRTITPPDGRCWAVARENYEKLVADKKMYFGSDGNGQPAVKRFLSDMDGMVPWTWWDHKEAGHSQGGLKETMDLFGRNGTFTTAKPTKLVGRIIRIGAKQHDTILDFFAGSGSTGHAVINLNREDGGDRKYILIEMGEHFDTVLVPRLKKVIYSKDWKDGKPQSRDTGVSHCFKILRLESYEDTLNNLRLHRTREQELALDALSPEAREQYRLGYQLDLESAGSQSLLNVSAFTDPWNYTLDVASGSAGETRPVKVDLVETFHWLLGLTILAQGRGGGVHWTEGTNPEGEKVLVLWRSTTEVDADALNEWCRKQKIKVLDGEFALIYVNGDHHLENLRRDDQTWKVRLIDEEFPRLMWEGCE
jgi:adenine-specific DNA-methyltransferase